MSIICRQRGLGTPTTCFRDRRDDCVRYQETGRSRQEKGDFDFDWWENSGRFGGPLVEWPFRSISRHTI